MNGPRDSLNVDDGEPLFEQRGRRCPVELHGADVAPRLARLIDLIFLRTRCVVRRIDGLTVGQQLKMRISWGAIIGESSNPASPVRSVSWIAMPHANGSPIRLFPSEVTTPAQSRTFVSSLLWTTIVFWRNVVAPFALSITLKGSAPVSAAFSAKVLLTSVIVPKF